MSDTYMMGCGEFADVAAELALGVLTGRERALALAHLDQCESCRENVRQLTMTGEELLGLLPAIEPPAGFETRVMERIGLGTPSPGPAPARRLSMPGRVRRLSMPGLTRRMLAAAAIVLAVVAAGLGGWGLRAATSSSAASAPLSASALLSASHQTVGEIFVYDGSPRWAYMSVDMDSGNGTVTCQLVGKDGHVTTVGSFRLHDGYGSWVSSRPLGNGPLAGARLLSADGTVLATASFSGA